MSIRKYGSSDDQRLALDREEDELLRRTGAARTELSPEDAEALERETAEG